MLSNDPTPTRTSGMAICTPATMVLRLVRRVAITGSIDAELSTRKNTSARRMRVENVNSRNSCIPVIGGG